jgi:hypothetical protein
MRYHVRQFTSMKLALKDLEQFVRKPALLQTGRPLKQFGDMLPREVLANWLLCATVNAVEGRQLVFSSDPTGGDGIIRDKATHELFPTEHVLVPRLSAPEGADAQTLILEAIEQKRTKGGAAYASGKTLVVFLDVDGGEWFPNRVARALPVPLHFATVWVVCFLKRTDDGQYIYGVTHLDVSKGDAPTFLVRITKAFDAWNVVDVQ